MTKIWNNKKNYKIQNNSYLDLDSDLTVCVVQVSSFNWLFWFFFHVTLRVHHASCNFQRFRTNELVVIIVDQPLSIIHWSHQLNSSTFFARQVSKQQSFPLHVPQFGWRKYRRDFLVTNLKSAGRYFIWFDSLFEFECWVKLRFKLIKYIFFVEGGGKHMHYMSFHIQAKLRLLLTLALCLQSDRCLRSELDVDQPPQHYWTHSS